MNLTNVRSRVRRLSPATVMSAAALFISLGGVGYAATGGSFILGTPNSAANTSGLSSNVTTGPALALKDTGGKPAASFAVDTGVSPFTVNSQARVANLNASLLNGVPSSGFVKNAPPISLSGPGGENVLTATNAGNGRGLAGFSDSWQGVYGHSNENAGIVGESLNFDGVYGVSQSATHAAVSAHNDGFGGFGVWAAGGDVANGTAAIHGGSAKGNAVEGISAKNTASGVYGQNDATGYGVAGRATNGTGVLADSANGWALKASGNATQSRAGSGFVKAMAFIDPFNSADPIRQCFNSQLPPSQATSGDCDIIYTKISTGYYNFDFGFQVNDRFVSVTPTRYLSEMTVLPTGTNTQWDVVTSGPSDNRFFIFVY